MKRVYLVFWDLDSTVVAWYCSISEELDTNAEWQLESRRRVPPVHCHVSHTGHKSPRHSQLRSERPTNLRSAAATAAAAPSTTKQGLQLYLIFWSSTPTSLLLWHLLIGWQKVIWPGTVFLRARCLWKPCSSNTQTFFCGEPGLIQSNFQKQVGHFIKN